MGTRSKRLLSSASGDRGPTGSHIRGIAETVHSPARDDLGHRIVFHDQNVSRWLGASADAASGRIVVAGTEAKFRAPAGGSGVRRAPSDTTSTVKPPSRPTGCASGADAWLRVPIR